MSQAVVPTVFVVEKDQRVRQRIREIQRRASSADALWMRVKGRHLAQLRVLTEVCRALTATSSAEEIFRVVMPHSAELLGSDRVLLLLPNDDGQLRVRAAYGVEPGLLVRCNASDDSLEDRVQAALGAASPTQVLTAPLLLRERPPGLLAVYPARTLAEQDAWALAALAEQDVWALAALADQTAVALDHVDLGARRQDEALLGLLVDAFSDHVLIALDPDGRVETWNHGARRALGYTAEEALGLPFVAFYAPGQGELPATSLRLAAEQGRHEGEATWICKDRRPLLASVLIVAFSEAEAEGRRGFAVLARDITVMRAAEEARRAAEREQLRAESANRMKDEFLATLSHELRTPLTAILGWARILRDADYDRARVVKGVEIIERNARAQVRIVEDILDVSRIITGKVKLEIRPVDPRAVIDAAVSTLESNASACGVTLEVRVEPALGCVIGDGERLQQVLWNLLSNAIKFTPPGGRVELWARRSGDQLEISVRDTGRGITPGFLPHVFERFVQDDASTTRAIGGLGLGLAIVRQIVELHRGTVAADSDGPGRGATFTVRLPAVDCAARPPPPTRSLTTSPEQTIALIGLSLLVVDDEPDMRDLLTTIFVASGARVTAVDSARAALARLQAGGIDLLVSDISMPGEDGFWLIHQVRSSADPRLRAVPALALTAYARAEDRHRVQGAGFEAYLCKPIQPDELVKVVGDLAARLVVRDPAAPA